MRLHPSTTLALLTFQYALTFAETATAPGTAVSIHETLFGELGYDNAIPYLDVAWPPLKSLHINDRKAARSIFVVNIRSDIPEEPASVGGAGDYATPWLSRVRYAQLTRMPTASGIATLLVSIAGTSRAQNLSAAGIGVRRRGVGASQSLPRYALPSRRWALRLRAPLCADIRVVERPPIAGGDFQHAAS